MTRVSGHQMNQLTAIFAICTLFMLVKWTATAMYAANMEDHPPEDAGYGLPKPPEDIKRRFELKIRPSSSASEV